MLEQDKLWIDIKKLRKDHGWLQSETADRLGVTRSHLSAVENGKRRISTKMITAIVRIFDVKLDDFTIRCE